MSARTFLVSLAAAAMALIGPGLASAQPAAMPSQAGSVAPPVTAPPAQGIIAGADLTSSAYVLGRDDVVEVGLLGGVGGFGGRARVQADGTIQLTMIGKVVAVDHTTAELSDTIRKALKDGGFYADPVVTIEVVGYASRYVTVLGAVGSPGLVPINRPYRLSEILARVGGVREGAADFLIVRPDNGPEKRLYIRDLATGDDKQDPYVRPGDKIFSPVAETYYLNGAVKSPGAFSMKTDLTFRMALAKAGGVTETGSEKKFTVMRAGKKTKVNLDDKVEAGDVINFGEKLF
ncbi:SLBB domain-containing protein [Phenylobacterium sp.]|uniref:SLBB domain-containing protein n=1 Tax=Phenylobacterium sp. TaxID=1871053 RepID=UPI0025E324D6|nr:SLBB domain-containing protein [Phenylobacterium sp.]